MPPYPYRSYRYRARRYTPYRRRFRRFIRRRYPRGYRRSPMYVAFRQIKNLQRQVETKYVDDSIQTPITFNNTTPHYVFSLSRTNIPQGTGGSSRIGRRIKLTSVTMNLTIRVPDAILPENLPTFRILGYIWKDGTPSSNPSDLFTQVTNLPETYWVDAARYSKKTIMDRKFTFSADQPVIQRTFRFRIPPRIITTCGSDAYNNLYVMVLTNSSDTANDYAEMTATYRVSFKDA